MKPTDDSNSDLQHFLRLACAQVGHRSKKTEIKQSDRDRLRLLEALIKEQLPNEDSNSATRATR